ncbi:MAG: hypothetical protein HDQ99_00725 [Lachnospiraceae bacterium]|nr:hypothetical protein [Lachnospiraceae bacterium]
MANQYNKVHMGEAKCALDLGDGSERAEYVCQDYILHKLGRPHRCVNIMYTYYPKDKEWPQRISEACKDLDISFQWDYPYDDYFPYDVDGQPFEQMRDIRRHGQDVLLTLTIDCSLDDEQLRKVARQLKPFGRMRIRINHECGGTWFTHNKRFSYQEVADFFVRFHNIIKEEAPNVSTIFCAGFMKADGSGVEYEKEFLDAYKAADIWSADCYLALHYGWPYDVAEVGGGQYKSDDVPGYYEKFKNTAERLTALCGKKPMTTAEFNTDGDVTGAFAQGESVVRFAETFRDNHAEDWFKGISMYQFRDRGRLGLEIEDPNNKSVGIEQPMLEEYKKVLHDPYFMPKMTSGEEVQFPVTMRWGSSEDADGIEIPVDFEGTPEFCEITVEDKIALMIEINGHWFYKAPDVKTIDLMSAFFKDKLDGSKQLKVKLFATPADGENHDDGREDWNYNYYTEMKNPPEFRIRYEVPGKVG